MNINKAAMDKMLETASVKLGIPADELRELLAKGDMEAIMAKMNGADAEKLKKAMNDPKVAEQMKGFAGQYGQQGQ